MTTEITEILVEKIDISKKSHQTILWVKVGKCFRESYVVVREPENVDEVVRESEKVGNRWPRPFVVLWT